MTDRELVNSWFVGLESSSFELGGFRFQIHCPWSKKTVTNPVDFVDYNRVIKVSGQVSVPSDTIPSSVLYSGRGNYDDESLLDDVLALASIISGHNWALNDRWLHPSYPVTATNHLECICEDADDFNKLITSAFSKITNSEWRGEFDNGFHLVMLLNSSNINNTEGRFLSYMVIWEWLYAHLEKNESNNLGVIVKYLMEWYCGDKYKASEVDFFHVFRNQLAHSGRLPIDRRAAVEWMKSPDLEFGRYLRFFGRLTQALVMKTIGIDIEHRLNHFDFSNQLDAYCNSRINLRSLVISQ